MQLTRHQSAEGLRWALDGRSLPSHINLSLLLELPRQVMLDLLTRLPDEGQASGELLPPLDPLHEVWASGVTYQRSRDARKAESTVQDVYEMVYEAARPEIFFKAIGWRVAGNGVPVRIRRDSGWDVPEPELVLVINRHREIVGYCAGNDMSSRSIEGENPLYLPQAKMYDGSCAIGPGIVLAQAAELTELSISLEIRRDQQPIFAATTSTAQMKRSLTELVEYLTQELAFPYGVLLMTGTGIVPAEEFTLQAGDTIEVNVGACRLVNRVTQ